MIIGKFQHKDGVCSGVVPFMTTLPVRIEKTERLDIDFVVTACGVEIGAGWKKMSAKGEMYLSITLDFPFLPAPVNCELSGSLADGYNLVWRGENQKLN